MCTVVSTSAGCTPCNKAGVAWPTLPDAPLAVGGIRLNVESYPANAYGLFDMAGNVFEWTADGYSENYYQNPPLQNPPGPSTRDFRVMRGGSWFDSAGYLHLALVP